MQHVLRLIAMFKGLLATQARLLAVAGLAAILVAACAGGPQPAAGAGAAVESQAQPPAASPTPEASPSPPVAAPSGGAPAEVVVYASDLPEGALYEFEFWEDPESPMGTMVGTPNEGGDLDPPPENDPNVAFTVPVRSGVPYRCWIHMKVGEPKGWSKANKVWVQFTDAVDAANQEILKPDTASYLTAQGPDQQGWTWVGCNPVGSETPEAPVYFRVDGDVTVRIQAGMEGVGFDQFLLSPAQYLEQPPSSAIVEKTATGG